MIVLRHNYPASKLSRLWKKPILGQHTCNGNIFLEIVLVVVNMTVRPPVAALVTDGV